MNNISIESILSESLFMPFKNKRIAELSSIYVIINILIAIIESIIHPSASTSIASYIIKYFIIVTIGFLMLQITMIAIMVSAFYEKDHRTDKLSSIIKSRYAISIKTIILIGIIAFGPVLLLALFEIIITHPTSLTIHVDPSYFWINNVLLLYAIYALIRLFIALPITIFSKDNAINSLKSSWIATKRQVLSVFVVLVVIFIIFLILETITNTVGVFVSTSSDYYIISNITTAFASAFLAIWVMLASVLSYKQITNIEQHKMNGEVLVLDEFRDENSINKLNLNGETI